MKCIECGHEIAKSAKACPNCGAPNKKPLYKKWWIWAIAAVIAIGIANSNNTNKNQNDAIPAQESIATQETAMVENSEQPKENIEDKKESVFEDVGYFKIENGTGGYNRSFTVFTTSTDENEMIEYARKKMYSFGGFTYVHFYKDKEHTPDITLYNPNTPELAYNPENNSEYRIMVYNKSPNENEFIWNADMSESKKIEK